MAEEVHNSRMAGDKNKGTGFPSRTWALIIGFAILLVFSAPRMYGQLYSGSISGQVTDPSQAVIPNATVTATDVEKHYVYTARTDAVGRYTFRQLPPGQYTLTVESNGFDKYVREAFSVDVGASVTVDASLHVQTGSATVTVSDDSAPLLQTETAALSQQINRQLLNNLPLVGRNALSLVDLSPGVNPPAGQQFSASTPTDFNSNGGRNMQSDILMDGVSLTNTENNGGDTQIQYTPPLETIQEFSVQQGNFSAEYGYTGGAVVNAITRSGTNQYHGELYGIMQNRAFDANSFFNNRAGTPLPAVHWNDFGGTAGGPVWIPHVYNGHGKTFFFAAVDITHTRNAASETGGVPSPAEKAGDFGEVCTYAGGTFDGSGRCSADAGQLWDPFSGLVDGSGNAVLDPVTGNAQRQTFIPYNNLATYSSAGNPGDPNNPNGSLPSGPGNLIDPVAAKLMQYFPDPNLNVGASNYNQFLNWYGAGTGHSAGRDVTVKIDHRFNDAHLLSGKFSRQWSPLGVGNPNLFNNAGDEFTQGEGHGLSYSITGNYTWTISQKTVLSLFLGDTYGYSGNNNLLNSTYKGLDPVTTLGMPTYIDDSGYPSFPQTYIQNFLGVGNQGWSNFTTGYETRHLLGSLTHLVGNHELKFGGEVRFRYMNMIFNGEPAGVMNFNQAGTSREEGYGGGDGVSGNGMATFLMGDNDGWGGYEIPVRPETSSKQIGMYVQDNWKVNDRLTLNLGLRYDIETPRTERHNRMSFFDPDAAPPSEIAGVAGAQGGIGYVGVDGNGRGISPIYLAEIQPRFGFAFRLAKNTSVRGGYGIYYEQSMTGIAGLGVSSFNGFSVTTNNVNFYNGNLARPYSFLRNPYPQGILQPQGATYGPGLYLGSTFTAPIPKWNKIPQEQSWSLDVQQQFFGDFLVDIGYVGTKGTHLYGAPPGLDYLPAQAAAQFRADPSAALANVPNPFYGLIPGAASTVPQWKLWRPFPQYDNQNSVAVLGTALPEAASIYHALQIKVEKRYSNGLQILANYVWSKSMDDASLISAGTSFLGGSVSLQDPNNFAGEWSLSQFNIPQVFNLAFTYELPFGRGARYGRTMNRLADLAVGGWHVNSSYRIDNGQPLALGLNTSDPLPTYSQRPQLSGMLKKKSGVNIDGFFANPEVIGAPAPYMDGNESRTDGHLRAPGGNTMNASMFKDFPLGFREGAKAQFRAEFSNILNHPVFGAPNTTWGSPTFGLITTQANSPRVGEVGLKLYF